MNITGTEVIEVLLTAFNERRWSDVGARYHPEAVIDYPQSGERITGRANIEGLAGAFPAPPTFSIVRSHGNDDGVTVQIEADYHDDAAWMAVFIYELEGDLVTHEWAYFSGPFEAAAWREPFRDALG